MKVNIQNEILTVTSYTMLSKSVVLYTENPNGIVKVFIYVWSKGRCKLILQYNKYSLAEIEYVEKRLNEWWVEKCILEDKKLQNKKPNTHGNE